MFHCFDRPFPTPIVVPLQATPKPEKSTSAADAKKSAAAPAASRFFVRLIIRQLHGRDTTILSPELDGALGDSGSASATASAGGSSSPSADSPTDYAAACQAAELPFTNALQALEVAINSTTPAARNAANFKHNHMYANLCGDAWVGSLALSVPNIHHIPTNGWYPKLIEFSCCFELVLWFCIESHALTGFISHLCLVSRFFSPQNAGS
jgi:hypothetical protein